MKATKKKTQKTKATERVSNVIEPDRLREQLTRIVGAKAAQPAKPKRLNPLRKRPNAAKARAAASKKRHRKTSKWCHKCLPKKVEAVKLKDGTYRTYCRLCTRKYMKAYMQRKREVDPKYGQV